jgi:hypothetical protein
MEEQSSLRKGELTLTIPEHGDKKREWPRAVNQCYDNGHRFGFAVKKTKRITIWEWPWPEWIGLPTVSTLQEWFAVLDDWKAQHITYLGASDLIDDERIERCVRLVIARI